MVLPGRRGGPIRSLGSPYEIAVPLTAEQKGKVEDRAQDEVRSVSSLVALLIVADLGRG